MRYALALTDGTVVVNQDESFMRRLCVARGLPESSIVSTDDSPEANAARAAAKSTIDMVANEVYSLYVQSAGLLKEYQQAEEDAKAFMSDSSVVPQSVTSWAKPKGWTNLQAAEDILASATKLRFVMGKIREVRLAYKSLVDSAATVADVQQLVAVAIATLNKLRG